MLDPGSEMNIVSRMLVLLKEGQIGRGRDETHRTWESGK